jgi:hypothetical protein
MNVFIAFILACFILSGTRLAEPLMKRPLLMMAGCVVVGASFYSLRVIS